MIAETSSNETGGSKAAWITDMLATQLPTQFPRVKAVLWFNWNITEFGQVQNWAIESSSTAQQAFKAAIGSSRYVAGGSFGSAEGLGKILPPS